MTTETEQAALAESDNQFQGDDQALDSVSSDAAQADSAPANNESESQEVKTESDGFQKRINKVTADKYAEKRRADALQAKLDELSKSPSQEQAKAPKLEDYDYDNDKYNDALIDYRVQQALEKQAEQQKQISADLAAQEAANSFNQRIQEFGKADFAEKANAIPQLPEGVASALMQSEGGVELIYHLGTHLDKADAIASMPPAVAMMELGKMQAELSAKPNIKHSAAPDPIEPLSTGGSVAKERGPKGATFE